MRRRRLEGEQTLVTFWGLYLTLCVGVCTGPAIGPAHIGGKIALPTTTINSDAFWFLLEPWAQRPQPLFKWNTL